MAFETATGFGRHTKGGRGGVVYEVTTLEDGDGPGTLRFALLQRHPRVIRFAVSGIIMLERPLVIEQGNVTLEGQTSPRGVVVAGAPVEIRADEVIVRYLRFRLGTFGQVGDSLNAIGCRSVIIDHCSMSWSTDEAASFYNNEDFTLQYCLVTNSLRDSIHPKGRHGYAGIWGGRRASFLNNVIANHDDRLPRVNGHRMEAGYPVEQELVEIVNNFIYNWGKGNVYGAEDGKLDLIGNYYLPGPDSAAELFLLLYPSEQGVSEVYVAGNVYAGKQDLSDRNHAGVHEKRHSGSSLSQRLVNSRRVSEVRDIRPATELLTTLIRDRAAGANLVGEGPRLDSVDTAVYVQIEKSLNREPLEHAILDHELEQISSWEEYAREFEPAGVKQ